MWWGGGSGRILGSGFFSRARAWLFNFYLVYYTVLDFAARIMRLKTKQKVYYISVDSDLEMDTNVSFCKNWIQELRKVLF